MAVSRKRKAWLKKYSLRPDVRARRLAARMRYYWKVAAALAARGLTTQGKPRKLKRRPELEQFHGEERKRQYQRLIKRKRVERGLTTKGTIRKPIKYPQLKGLNRRNWIAEYQRIRKATQARERSRAAIGVLLKGANQTIKLRRAA